MFSKLPGNLFSLFSPACRKFASKEQLVGALRMADPAAIECLIEKSEAQVRRMARKLRLDEDSVMDAIHDGLIILIEKIRDGSFDPKKSAPATYLIAICRNILANKSRLKRPPGFVDLGTEIDFADDSLNELLDFREKRAILDELLALLGPPASDLIRLKYLEGYSDETQIAENMTPYTTHESLRVMRSRGMKSLVELAAKWKSKHDAI